MGGQGGCERRIKVFVKMQKKKNFFWAGGSKGGGGRGRVGGGGQGEDLSDYNRFPKFQPIDNWLDVNERFSIIIDHRNNTSIYTG